MSVTTEAAPARRVSAKTLGVLAVIGLVAAFSLSSTLVKRAETPGVLVAFWRMLAVSVLWNALLWWRTRQHVTRADARQVWLPGVCFGLNLAVFFALHNLFDRTRTLSAGPATLDLPVLSSADPVAFAITAVALALVFVARWSTMRTLGVCAALGLASTVVG